VENFTVFLLDKEIGKMIMKWQQNWNLAAAWKISIANAALTPNNFI